VRAPALVLVISLGAAGCGSAGGPNGTGRLPADVASGLAARAEQVAASLDAGACDDALAEARSLQADIAALPVEPAVRAEALAGAARLASGISCPVTSTTAVTLPVDGKKGKGHKGDHDDG
jgi:hypothetical protein